MFEKNRKSLRRAIPVMLKLTCAVILNAAIAYGQECVRANPTVTINAPNHSALAGQLIKYNVSVTNNDSAACNVSFFTVIPEFPRPGWVHTPICESFLIAPGESAARDVTIHSPSTACPIAHTIVEVAKNDSAPEFSGSAKAVFELKSIVPGPLSPECAREAAGTTLSLVKGRVSAVSWQDKFDTTGVSVFTVGVDGHLLQRVSGLGQDWRWEDHGTPRGTIINSAPAAVVYQAGGLLRFHVFAAGLNGHLMERRSKDGKEWEWVDHGLLPPAADTPGFMRTPVPVASDPAVITWIDSVSKRRINVFVRSSDGRLIERWTEDGNNWQWEDRGGTTGATMETFLGNGSPLAIVGQRRNTFHPIPDDTITDVYVFMRGRNGNLWEGHGVGALGSISRWAWKNHKKPEFGPNFDRFHMNIISDASGFAWFDGDDKKDVRYNVFVVGEHESGFRDLLELSFDGNLRGKRDWVLHTQETGITRLSNDRPTIAAWGNLGAFGPGFGVNFRVFGRSEKGSLVSYTRDDIDLPPIDGSDRISGDGRFAEESYPLCSTIKSDGTCSDFRGSDRAFFTPSFQIAAAPSVIVRQTDVSELVTRVFANRANGTLIENDASRAGLFSWDTSHVPTNLIKIENSGNSTKLASDGGLCNQGSQVVSVFPQWTLVNPPSGGKDPDDVILEGIVVASKTSMLDNPFNHSHDKTAGARPIVTHDWNIHVAPDTKYQHLLADTNLLEGGSIEVEWELSPDKLPLSGVPGVGDRVWIKGRWIYDCGHPPPQTEIHPPNALSVIRNEPFVPSDFGFTGSTPVPSTRAVTTLSPNGGTVLYPLPKDCKVEKKLSFTKLTDFILSYEACSAFGGFGASCKLDLALLEPDKFCYGDLVSPPTDVEFDVPLPPRPSVDAKPAIFGRGNIASISRAEPASNPDHFHIRLPDAASPSTLELVAHWVDPSNNFITSPTVRHLKVLFEVEPQRPRDTFSKQVLYVGANGHFARILPDKSREASVNVDVSEDKTLEVSSHGFQCLLSCGSIDVEDLFKIPNNLAGTVLATFDRDSNFGLSHEFTVCSQPALDSSSLQAFVSTCDYKLKIKIIEIRTP
jgi:hypothetical protein